MPNFNRNRLGKIVGTTIAPRSKRTSGGKSVHSNWIGVSTPKAPTGLSVSSKTSVAVIIAFTAPEDNGGAPITNYAYSTNGTTFTALNPVDATSPVTITGLTAGTAYTFYLAAINEIGTGDSSSGLAVTSGNPTPSIEYMVVAGGAGGNNAAGGGAGGLQESSTSVTTGTVYTITVGGGGNGNAGGRSSVGGGSSAFALSCNGGGFAGATYENGGAGGSGGGAGTSNGGQVYGGGGGGTAGQGNAGGGSGHVCGGGGGGKSSAGAGGGSTSNGGGAGINTSLSNGARSFGGAGLQDGIGGTAGGGGSGGSGNNSGGGGCVIVRYSNSYDDIASPSVGYAFSNSGGYKTYIITGSGTLTF